MASDQGEKIVFLARELLNAGMQEDPAPKAQKTHITMSFKTLCLTTILAAAGGCGVATMAARANERPLNRYEKTEIDALLFYAARVKGLDEAALRREVAARVGVVRLDDMTEGDFPVARRFLQNKAQ